MKVLTIGRSIYNTSIDVDFYPAEGTTNNFTDALESIFGFAPLCAYLFSKYGFESYIASGIGDDSFGNNLKKTLEKNNIHTENMETFYDKRTILANTLISKSSKKNTINIIEKEKLNLKKNDFSVVPDIIMSDGYDYSATLTTFNKYPKTNSVLFTSACSNETVELAKYPGYIVATKEFAEFVSGIKMNFESPQSLVDAYMALIKKFTGKNIVVTLNEKGALYVKDNQIKVMPPLKLDVVDSSGAAEVFASAFGLGISYNYEIEKAVTFASICSSVFSSKKGIEAFDNVGVINSYFNQRYAQGQNDNNK